MKTTDHEQRVEKPGEAAACSEAGWKQKKNRTHLSMGAARFT
jgi:hypothetical protein